MRLSIEDFPRAHGGGAGTWSDLVFASGYQFGIGCFAGRIAEDCRSGIFVFYALSVIGTGIAAEERKKRGEEK